jgi:biopolymer transport protein ExbD
MRALHTPEDEPLVEMNFIPLMDLALTLVMILLVSTVFIKHPGVSLKLPETVTREGAPETTKDLTVVIGADGGLYVDAEPVEPPALQSRLRAMAQENSEARVLVKGDRAVVYDRVMGVMDMVRQAGITRVVLPTDPKAVLGMNKPQRHEGHEEEGGEGGERKEREGPGDREGR